MPELPEIETIRRDLAIALTGDQAVKIEILDSRLMTKKEASQWNAVVTGQMWQSFSRQGKYLFANLANGWRAGFHMRMTGQLIVTTAMHSEKASNADSF